MDKYRRKKQVSDETVENFKPSEIQKIHANLPSQKQKKLFPLLSGLSMGAIVLVIALILIIPGQDESPYRLSRPTNTAYLLEADEEAFSFQFYFDFDIVTRGERTHFNETFDYFVPALYAGDSIAEAIDVSLSVYRYDQFRYFLASTVNGETSYLEVNVFKDQRQSLTLDYLDIEDFEVDFEALNDLLIEYPPILENSEYVSHPAIQSLPASRAKSNYLLYVEHYYTEENTFDETDITEQAIPSAVIKRHQVIVNDSGSIVDTDFLTAITFGHVSDIHRWIANFHHFEFFNFIPVDQDMPRPGSGMDLSMDEHGLTGNFTMQRYDSEFAYIYTTVYLNFSPEALKDSAYATIDYHLDNDNQAIQDLDVKFFNKALVVHPLKIPINLDDYDSFSDVFNELSITLYNDDNEPIHTITIQE